MTGRSSHQVVVGSSMAGKVLVSPLLDRELAKRRARPRSPFHSKPGRSYRVTLLPMGVCQYWSFHQRHYTHVHAALTALDGTHEVHLE